MRPTDLDVTVIGGHAGITILPLLSQARSAALPRPDMAAEAQRP